MIRNTRRLVLLVVAVAAAAVAFDAGAAAPGPTTLPMITRQQWGSKPQPIPDAKRHTPRLITLHHAGTLWTKGSDPVAKVRAMQSWGQREKGWPDLPYHYMIAPDGTIIEARDWHYQPESNTKYDLNGVLNIELFGNFEVQRVSVEQLTSIVNVIVHLKRDLGLPVEIDKIRGHKDAAETACPGKDFYRYIADGSIRKWVEQSLAGQRPEIKLLDALPGGPTTMAADTLPPAK